MMEDSLAEDRHSPVPGLVHRYPDRVLMLVTTQCASYCRYCTRSRIVGDPTQNFNRKDHEAQLEYLRRTPQVRDVLISGGDGLTLAPKLFESILRGLREIPHIEIIRIGSRVPVFLPQRIDDELCEMLEKYHPLWINLHFNHPNEITPEVSARGRQADQGRACRSATRASCSPASTTASTSSARSSTGSSRTGSGPYYLYQCDLVEGSGHFRTPVGKGLEIMEGLRGHTIGLRGPDLRDRRAGRRRQDPGHAELPDQLLGPQGRAPQLRGLHHDLRGAADLPAATTSAACAYCQHERPEPGQSGVLGLLEGERMWIEPKGFHEIHTRGNTEAHRLQDPSKWVPFGVGAIEGQATAPLRCWSRARRPPAGAAEYGPARSLGRATASRPAPPTGSCSYWDLRPTRSDQPARSMADPAPRHAAGARGVIIPNQPGWEGADVRHRARAIAAWEAAGPRRDDGRAACRVRGGELVDASRRPRNVDRRARATSRRLLVLRARGVASSRRSRTSARRFVPAGLDGADRAGSRPAAGASALATGCSSPGRGRTGRDRSSHGPGRRAARAAGVAFLLSSVSRHGWR